MSCAWKGIPLEKRKLSPIVSQNGCESSLEIRTYRVLFILPFIDHQLKQEIPLNPSEYFIIESNSYAKPWDIVFTTIGFLFSLNSSTETLIICPKQIVLESLQKQNTNSNKQTKLAHWQSIGSPLPIHSIQFAPDDHKLADDTKEKLKSLSKEIVKSEIKYKVILVGKSHTTGDISYQTRLVKRRFDEIRQILNQEFIEENRILTLMTEREVKQPKSDPSDDSQSSILIYLVVD